MRIARVLTRLNLGGPARQVLASDPRLVARGHEVRILAGRPEPGEGDLEPTFSRRGLEVVRVPSLRRSVSPARDLLARRQLVRELRAFRPDVLHTHASKAGWAGRKALRRAFPEGDVASVHTFHGHVLEGYFPGPVSRRLAAVERRLAEGTDRIVAVSHATGDDLVRLGVVDEGRLVVVPPGIELEPFLALDREGPSPGAELRARIGAGEGDLVLGCVGRLAEVKRPALALEVFRLLAARHPELHLVYVGDGDQRRALEAGIRGLPEPERRRVHLLGAVEDVVPVHAGLDLVLSTSRSEGMPVALIEAAAAGLAVVATPVGGVEELVAHERTGLLAGTAEELAFAVDQLAANPTERRAMGERARLRVRERHSGERLADRLEELYEVVVAERRGARTP